ncbi:MAG: TolC family protein [Acidobacteriota bacterium]|nr:TolC family protein [Acidobacteriota bacterium]
MAFFRRARQSPPMEGPMATLTRTLPTALLAASLALAPGVARAQSPASAPASPPPKITLDQAIHYALLRNPSLQAARTTVAQSKAEEVTANLRPNPVLGWDAQFIPLFSPSALTPDTIDNFSQFDMGLSYLFERGKKRQHRLAAAQEATAVTTSQVSDAERTLTFIVAQQFVAVLLAERTLAFAQQNLASFQSTVKISEAQYKAGDISYGDYLKIKLQLLQFELDVSSATLARQQALAGLRQTIGFESVPAGYDVSGTLNYTPLKLQRADLEKMALQLRPDLRAADQGITAAQGQYALAKANGKRDVTFTANYTHLGALNNASLFWTIQLPIFDRNQGEIARTNAAITQAQDSAIAARQQVLTDVSNAYDAVHEDGGSVELYQSGYLKQARDSRDISAYAFQRGGASLLDLLDAERSYRAVELGYFETLASYQLALEQLREAVGARRLP